MLPAKAPLLAYRSWTSVVVKVEVAPVSDVSQLMP
jgi:hypothetical protein